MSLPIQKFREMVFQMLYCSLASSEVEMRDLVEMMMHELKVTRNAATQAYQRVQQILAAVNEIDARIAAVSQEYQFERISCVEKNVLRLGVYELFYDDAIPPKVAIAEAIRLCRKFGTPESSQFVNAILDGLFQKASAVYTECDSKVGL